MDRRSFFRSMVGGVATAAAVRTWPFRVFSFPNEIQSGLYDVTITTWPSLGRGDIFAVKPLDFSDSLRASLVFEKKLVGEMAQAFAFEWADEVPLTLQTTFIGKSIWDDAEKRFTT